MISSVYIAKNVYGGDGLGRLGDGRVIFVPGAWAGELVRAEIVEEKKTFVKGRLVEVVEASPNRISPKNAVPGMVYAALSFEGECATKSEQLRDFFVRSRISSVNPITDISCAIKPLNYRNKVVYHLERRKNGFAIGYRTEPTHEVVDVSEDPLAREEINAKLPEIRRDVLRLLTVGPEAIRRETEKKENVTIRWTKKTGVKWWLGAAPKDLVLKETTCGRDFEVPADGFYQVNPEVGDALVKAVMAEYAKNVELAPEVLDLYCGVGVFGICCRPEKLTGIESGRRAIEFAKRNAANDRYRFFAEEVGKNLRRIAVSPRTTVIVDPPRGGLEKGVARWLAQSKAPRIFYVSCDPATLMRDLKEICNGYDVESVKGFNMFPRTARFETLVVLRKKTLNYKGDKVNG